MKNEFKRNIAIALSFLALIIVACFPLLSNQVLAVKGDGLGYVTGKIFMMDSLKAGEFPFWNPYAGIGTPFLADVQNTVFSPLNILYFIFDVPLAFNLMRIVQMFLACYFMYLLVEELTTDRMVSFVAGAVFGFSTMMGGIRIEHHTFATTIALFPAVLYYLEKYRLSQNEKWLACSTITMAVQFLSGFTQICLYFDILAFAYFVYILWETNTAFKESICKIVKWGSSYLTLIAVQLLPLLQLMHQSGRDNVSWDFFSAYSYDFRILLMMLFPYAYENNDGYRVVFDAYHSSEMDIEIYIGIICLVYIIYEILYHYKEKRTRILTNIAITALGFGMIAHIPVVRKIVFYIPVLGSFRCSARALFLFLFLFLVLFGLGLSHIKERKELKKILKVSRYFIVLLACNLLVMFCVFSQNMLFTTELTQAYRPKFLLCMCMALAMLLLNHMLLKVVEGSGEKKIVIKVVTVLLGIVIVCDVSRFSRIPEGAIDAVQDVLPSHLPTAVDETVKTDTDNYYRTFLEVKELPDTSYQYTRLGQSGRALSEGKLLYNSYLTFLDGKLGFWGIKETFLYPQFIKAEKNQNDLISMMGVRHIVDSKNSHINWSGTDGAVERCMSELSGVVLPKAAGISAFAWETDWIEENSFYEIIVECKEENPPSFFNVDLYGKNYDDTEQESALYKTAKENEYRAVISTASIPPDIPIYFRIMGNGEKEILIDHVKVNKLKTETILQKCPVEDEDVQIYENVNARPLLYIPDYIYSIESYGENWIESGMQAVDKNNYIEGFGKTMDLTAGKAIIQDIDMLRNSIQAKVVADRDIFVNFSQLSYPGWKAYVDGQRVKCYTVNNLIMGAEVPEGTHSIEFRFSPDDVKIGLLITIAGMLATLLWIFDIKPWRRRK